jgi:hypothetical protein
MGRSFLSAERDVASYRPHGQTDVRKFDNAFHEIKSGRTPRAGLLTKAFGVGSLAKKFGAGSD